MLRGVAAASTFQGPADLAADPQYCFGGLSGKWSSILMISARSLLPINVAVSAKNRCLTELARVRPLDGPRPWQEQKLRALL